VENVKSPELFIMNTHYGLALAFRMNYIFNKYCMQGGWLRMITTGHLFPKYYVSSPQ